MLTRLRVRRFKRLQEADIELGRRVVFVGPNDAGKTTALQALTLWRLGLRRWTERRGTDRPPVERSGVAINRRDLTGIPAATAKALWHDLRLADNWKEDGRSRHEKRRIEVIVDGVTDGVAWSYGLEFDYANDESIYVRPTLARGVEERPPVPPEARSTEVALLAPMSGLVAEETVLTTGALDVRIGEGRTAEVLRNLCHSVVQQDEEREGPARFDGIAADIARLFGARIDRPREIVERGVIEMTYTTPDGVSLDLAASGRGMQQTLLLLSFMSLHPGAVLLLDEPDAHLEILRQRQTYELIGRTAEQTGGQLIAASHSEVVLQEAAQRDVVVAFLGAPHRIDDRGSQVAKSLREIGFDAYYQAEQTGWVLFLEGSTDLSILQAWARTLEHRGAQAALDRPHVIHVGNQLPRAKHDFYGLKEAVPRLRGFVLLDRQATATGPDDGPLQVHTWSRNEIENYLATPETLRNWARAGGTPHDLGGLFAGEQVQRWVDAVDDALRQLVPPIALDDPSDRYWRDVKASDDLLDRLFPLVARSVPEADLVRKNAYHVLAEHVPPGELDDEVRRVLDQIAAVATAAEDSALP